MSRETLAIVAGGVLLLCALLASALLLARSLAQTRAELARVHARLDAQAGAQPGSRPTQAAPPVPVVTDLGRSDQVALVPTSRQVVEATMRQPLVRVAVWSAGVRHALRPESRDRARALARRELQRRAKVRRRAAREAARTATASAQSWPDGTDAGERAS